MQLETEVASQIPVYHFMQCTALSPHNSLACQNWHYWSKFIRKKQSKNINDFMPFHADTKKNPLFFFVRFPCDLLNQVLTYLKTGHFSICLTK